MVTKGSSLFFFLFLGGGGGGGAIGHMAFGHNFISQISMSHNPRISLFTSARCWEHACTHGCLPHLSRYSSPLAERKLANISNNNIQYVYPSAGPHFTSDIRPGGPHIAYTGMGMASLIRTIQTRQAQLNCGERGKKLC